MLDPRANTIENLLSKHHKSVRWLAKEVNTAHTQVRAWLSGENQPRNESVWDAMLKALLSLERPEGVVPLHVSEAKPLYRTPMRYIPVGGPAYCGIPEWGKEDVSMYEIKDWGGNFDRWGKVVSGMSMFPLLEPGDIAVFENRRAEIGNIVHAHSEDSDIIKVLAPTTLRSINPDHPDVATPSDWEILGVLVIIIREQGGGHTITHEYKHGATHRWH